MIVVPHVTLRAETRAALDASGHVWRGAYVGTDDAAYFRLLASLWAAGGTFTVVEHDIIPTREALDSLESCDAEWCASPYPYLYGELMFGLGCTRFRSGLIARHPDLFNVVAGMFDSGHPPMHWCRLDAWMFQTLMARGETRCESHSLVDHLTGRRGSSHGCYVI